MADTPTNQLIYNLSNFTALHAPYLILEKFCSIFEQKDNRHLQAGLPVPHLNYCLKDHIFKLAIF